MQFRVSEIGCFEETIVHNFQRRLLRKELAASLRAIEDASNRLAVQRLTIAKLNLPEHIMRNVVFHSRALARQVNKETCERHDKKIAGLATRQDKPLRGIGTTVSTIVDVELPRWATDVLTLGPKHPVRTKFNELHFLADADTFLAELKREGASVDTLNEVNGSVTWNIKSAKQQGADRLVEKVKQTEGAKLQTEGAKPLTIKIEEDLNQELLSLFRAGKISERIYNEFRSTGGTPPRLYGLVKVHKKDTPLRHVLSLPGSIYYNLNCKLSLFFQDIAGANIETSTVDMRNRLCC